MKRTYAGGRAVVMIGDCLDVLRDMPDNSVDAIPTDPPYGLSREPDMAEVLRHWLAGDDYVHRGTGFMGEAWDSFVPGPSVWRECLRVLKPGGHLLAFAGSRTYDLMGTSIRLAGFEIRDSITWHYSQGFVKGRDFPELDYRAAGRDTDADRWAGWNTALKPASEPIIVARKPLSEETVSANVLAHGTGGLNVDASRIPRGVGDRTEYGRGRELPHANTTTSLGKFAKVTPYRPHDAGRWPTNVVFTHDESCVDVAQGCVPGCPVRELDEQRPGASNFFPTFRYEAKVTKRERPPGTAHRTIKPLALMQWLSRLITPPGGRLLDPYAGSGTTIEAGLLGGFDCLAIEDDPDQLPAIEYRIDRTGLLAADFEEMAR